MAHAHNELVNYMDLYFLAAFCPVSFTDLKFNMKMVQGGWRTFSHQFYKKAFMKSQHWPNMSKRGTHSKIARSKT